MEGTKTINFIPRSLVPAHKIVTYGRIVVEEKIHKTEKYRTRLTVGGNLIQYDRDLSTPTADLFTIKILFNHVLSSPQAKFITCDIRNFYLNTPMPQKEFFKLPVKIIPEDIMKHYCLHPLIYKDHVYVQVNKGMYGLPQAGILAYK